MIGLFGGTFDPVHRGHLHAAIAVCDELGLESLRLMLSARPGHRDAPETSVAHRWAMLQLTADQDSRLCPDDRDCRRQGPSYTVTTLKSLRVEQPDAPLCWGLGWDQFRVLTEWHDWRQLLQLANLAVLPRPEPGALDGRQRPADLLAPRWWLDHVTELSSELRRLVEDCQRETLDGYRNGAIYFVRSPMLALSATQIRRRLAAAEPVEELLPPGVYTYIKEYGLYGVPSDL